MIANVLDLRYRTKEILKALRNREKVTIFYRGVETGVIHPVETLTEKPRTRDTEFFGMVAHAPEDVPEVMKRLRKPRHAL